jgi:serine/threonine-protein kinase
MKGTPADTARRNRALAELARARGWVADGALERALADASRDGTDVSGFLLKSGVLSEEQVRSLRQALTDSPDVAGPEATRVPPSSTRAPSPLDAATLRPGDTPSISRSGDAQTPAAFGPYRILRELGRGGMGVVYRALDPALRREVALKVLLSGGEANDAEIQRFRREAGILARLGQHPNLIPVHDIGHHEGRLYFTMEYVEGRSLRQRIVDEGPLPQRDAASLCADIAGGLEFVHRAGVVHRDVKPHNVLLDRAGRALLGDFGLARDAAAGAGLTATGEIFGTPHYMSPEQAAGHSRTAGPASDVWSLGATLFEALSGETPFQGDTALAVARAVIHDEPPLPSSLRPGLHPDLETICLKALRKDATARYASAGEMEADLRRWLRGEPIHARPVGTWERWSWKLRRNRGFAAAAAAGLLALATAGVWAAVKASRDAADRKARGDEARVRSERVDALMRDASQAFDRGAAAWYVGDAENAEPALQQAERALGEALRLAPESADVHYEIGRFLRWRGRSDTALKYLDKAIALNDRHAMACFERGELVQNLLWGAVFSVSRAIGEASASVVGPERTGLEKLDLVQVRELTPGEQEMSRRAAEDFKRGLDLGIAPDRVAYGRAMIASLERRWEDAILELDRAIALNGFDVRFHAFRADMVEAAGHGPEKALPSRRRACEVAPGHVYYRLELAKGLASCGQFEEALKAARMPLERVRPNFNWLFDASRICYACHDEAGAEEYAGEMLRLARNADEKAWAIGEVVRNRIHFRRFDAARQAIEENRECFPPEGYAAVMGNLCERQEKVSEALKWFRKIPKGCAMWYEWLLEIARIERICGNTGLALDLYAEAQEADIAPSDRMEIGIAWMEHGDFERANAELERVARERPDYNRTYVNLAGTRLMTGKYAEAMEAMQEAVMRTELPEAQKDAARKIFGTLRERAAAVRSPAEAARVVETLAGVLTLASGQVPEGSAAQYQVREGLRGIWHMLQQFHFKHGDLKASIKAGERCLKILESGAVYYRDARSRAADGKKKSVLRALEQAMEHGFDEGVLLDGEKSFDALRETPEFKAFRAKCR